MPLQFQYLLIRSQLHDPQLSWGTCPAFLCNEVAGITFTWSPKKPHNLETQWDQQNNYNLIQRRLAQKARWGNGPFFATFNAVQMDFKKAVKNMGFLKSLTIQKLSGETKLIQRELRWRQWKPLNDLYSTSYSTYNLKAVKIIKDRAKEFH